MKFKAHVEVITPERATELLGCRGSNRTIVPSRVAAYAHDMQCGKWATNHQGILVKSGVLVDGQHRLQAIVRSGVAVSMLVIYDMDDEGIDLGRVRNAGDILGIRGVQFGPRIVSSLNALEALFPGGIGKQSTITEKLDAAKKFEGDLNPFFQRWPTRRLMNTSLEVALWYSRPLNPHAIDKACEVIADRSIGLEIGDPLRLYRSITIDKDTRGKQHWLRRAGYQAFNAVLAAIEGRRMSRQLSTSMAFVHVATEREKLGLPVRPFPRQAQSVSEMFAEDS